MDSGANKSRKTREYLMCFTSRLSMKISSSKSSIVRPNNKLPSSLSRRLRASGSMKNGGPASPMFPTGGRKKGLENPEPSSPKVTCIGQVRVKTKKQGKKMRSLSSSRSRRESTSFRSDENHNMIQRQGSLNHSFHHQQQECSSSSSHRNQRWVHLPLTICETLRSFGADVSCLFPCNKSWCFSGDGGGKGKRERGSSCVGAFARWLVAVEEGGEKVVEEEEEEEVRSIRRHVFDEIEIREEGVSEGRVSVCVPPKNALLLMRCRSDPVKMEALANRFWEPQLDKEDEEDEDEVEEVVVVETLGDRNENLNDVLVLEKHRISIDERRRISVSFADNAEEEEGEEEEEEKCTEVDNGPQVEGQGKALMNELEINDQETREKGQVLVEDEKELSFVTALEALVDQETETEEEVDKNDEGSPVSYSFNSFTPHSESDEICKPDHQEEEVDLVQEVDTNEASNVDEEEEEEEEGKDQISQVEMMEKVTAEKEEENAVKIVEEKERKSVEIMDKENGLPDCLLLMMCEPKLSMEVSKETWVCSRDFIRYQPHKKKKPPVKVKEADEKRRLSVDSAAGNPFAALPPPHPTTTQPPRSSCSSTAAMATMIEQKLVNAVAYEPFVLTRCKSEPMRTAAKVAAWKSGGLEPHRRSTVGVGAAGF